MKNAQKNGKTIESDILGIRTKRISFFSHQKSFLIRFIDSRIRFHIMLINCCICNKKWDTINNEEKTHIQFREKFSGHGRIVFLVIWNSIEPDSGKKRVRSWVFASKKIKQKGTFIRV